MVAIIFIILSSVCKAICDKTNFHSEKTWLPDFFNPHLTWEWKYVGGVYATSGGKYRFFGLARYIPMDGWHICDLFRTIFFVVAVVYYKSIINHWDILLFIAIFQITFTILFDYILEK